MLCGHSQLLHSRKSAPQVQRRTNHKASSLGTLCLDELYKAKKFNEDKGVKDSILALCTDQILCQDFQMDKNPRRGFPAPKSSVDKNAGCSLWIDRSTVMIYVIDSNGTLNAPVIEPSKETVKDVRSIRTLRRWLSFEIMHLMILEAPAPFIAYNVL